MIGVFCVAQCGSSQCIKVDTHVNETFCLRLWSKAHLYNIEV